MTKHKVKIPVIQEKEKEEIVDFALEGASQLLLYTMDTCGIKNYIHGDIFDEKSGRKFTLKFDLIKDK